MAHSGTAELVSRGLVGACLLAATGSAALALQTPEELRQALVLVDQDQSRHFLDPGQIDALRGAAATGAATLLVLAGLLAALRQRFLQALEALETDSREFYASMQTALRLPPASDALTLTAIVVIGAAVRVMFLDRPMLFDEADSFVHYVLVDWFNLWTNYSAPNNHILYNFLAHLSVGAIGETALAARLPAFLSGMGVIAATFVVGRMLVGTQAGLAAAALSAGLAPLIGYSVNGRGYALIAFLFLLAIPPMTIAARKRSFGAWGAAAALIIAGLLTVPTMLYAFGAALLFGWLSAEQARRRPFFFESIGAVAVCGLSSVALYLPPAMRSTWDAILFNYFLEPTPAVGGGLVYGRLHLWWTSWAETTPLLLLIVIVASAIAGMRFHVCRRLLLALAIPAFALSLAGRFAPPNRVWLYMLPIFAIVAGAGFTHLAERFATARSGNVVRAAAVLATLVLSVSFVADQRRDSSFSQRFAREISDIAVWLHAEVHSDAMIIAPSNLNYSLRAALIQQGDGEVLVLEPKYLAASKLLRGREQTWIVRTRTDLQTERWHLIHGQLDWADPELAGFAPLRLVRETGYFELWTAERR